MKQQTLFKNSVRNLMEPWLANHGYKRRRKQPVFHVSSDEITVAFDCLPTRDRHFADRWRIGIYVAFESKRLMAFTRELFHSFEIAEVPDGDQIFSSPADSFFGMKPTDVGAEFAEYLFEDHSRRAIEMLSVAASGYQDALNCNTIKQFGEAFSSDPWLLNARHQRLAILAALVMHRNRMAALNFIPSTGYTPRLRSQLFEIVENNFAS